ncbi:MAG: 16S rRNA (uracil1498-N3)-methyltransferase [Phycisphaerales bacterium]|jgi:16S rRNA (uracil1498-N3)-methyltransferase
MTSTTPPNPQDTTPSPTPTPAANPHRVYCPNLADQAPGGLSDAGEMGVRVTGPEAHHALRVRRLREGDAIELFDGEGHTLASVYTSWRGSRQNPVMVLAPAGDLQSHSPISPRVEVLCPPPKPERLGPMIDQLSQIGVDSWIPLATARTQGSVHDFKREKLDRVVIESAKQCRRAWLLQIGEPIWFEDAAQLEGAVLFDASGEPGPIEPGSGKPADSVVRLLIGSEGGWTADELALAKQAGVATRRAGPHILRVETAAVVAATTVLHDARSDLGGPA